MKSYKIPGSEKVYASFGLYPCGPPSESIREEARGRLFNGVALAISQSQGRRLVRPSAIPVRPVCHSCDSYLASIVTSRGRPPPSLPLSPARPLAAPPLAEMTFA